MSSRNHSATAYYWFPMPIEEIDFEGLATHVAEDAILDAADRGSPVKISSKVVQGNAAKALLEAACGAELLVVGNRGHGSLTGALLGSVSQQCVHNATCPVVIVRDREPTSLSGQLLPHGSRSA